MNIPKWVENYDDERNCENGIIVTLHYGWSFEKNEHLGVKGFDTVTEAIKGMKKKNIYTCHCNVCLK
jgi:hypothetical protein